MLKIFIVRDSVLLCVLGLGPMSFATAEKNSTCSPDMASRADSFLLKPDVSWSQLSQHQITEGACDDGYFAEGYSDLVVRLFATRWKDFNAFVAVARTRPEFYSWVIRHIDETTSPDDLHRVISNASSCRKDPTLGRFCRDISRAAERALDRTLSR